MTKPRIRYRYRNRPVPEPEHWLAGITVGQIKQWLFVMVPVAVSVWAFAGPYVDAKAGEYLKDQLVQIGMDPATVQALNKNLAELQETVKAREEASKQLSEDVSDLKSILGTVLELQKLQVIKGDPPPTEAIK